MNGWRLLGSDCAKLTLLNRRSTMVSHRGAEAQRRRRKHWIDFMVTGFGQGHRGMRAKE
jgi:hypothetical protein